MSTKKQTIKNQPSEESKPQPKAIDDIRLRRIQKFFPWMVGLLSLLAIYSYYVEWWLLDIYVSFIPQIIIVLVTMFLFVFAIYGRFIVRDGWRSCWESVSLLDEFVLFTSAVILLYLMVSSVLIVNTRPVSDSEPNLKVATYNVLYTNPSIAGAANYFAEQEVDIVAMQEARPEFVEEVRQTLGYDYSAVTDCDCSAEDTEVGIVSKYPLINPRTVIEHQNGVIFRAEVQLDNNRSFAVYAVHIPPPFSNDWYQLRNDLIMKLGDLIRQDSLPAIAMGDFNTTIFSPSMHGFIDRNEGITQNVTQYSWPKCSWYGFSRINCARIDHIFVAEQFEIGERTIGEGFGSDHRPVLVELRVN